MILAFEDEEGRRLTVDDCERIEVTPQLLTVDCDGCPHRQLCPMRANRILDIGNPILYQRRLATAIRFYNLSQVFALTLDDITAREADDVILYAGMLETVRGEKLEKEIEKSKKK